jgi:hypothetical protein
MTQYLLMSSDPIIRLRMSPAPAFWLLMSWQSRLFFPMAFNNRLPLVIHGP